MSFPDHLIQSAEAAQILGIHRATFNRRVLAGDIPVAMKVPGMTGSRLFDRAVIEALAASTEVTA